MSHHFQVFIGKGVSALHPDDEPRYRLYVDSGIGVNLVGDRHRRGGVWPSSFAADGWELNPLSAPDMANLILSLDDMQQYFDEHFNGGIEKKGRVKKIQCNADKKTGGRALKAKR